MVEKLEEYAKLNNIPIIEKDSINYIIEYIKNNNVKNILEIGSAIGYSSIKMALVNKDIKITTIEKDRERYENAILNIKEFKLDNQINIILSDALNINLEDKYDLVFIDAAKTKNIEFFNHFKNNLNEKGVIITDNLSFHNLVSNSDDGLSRNVRGIVRKIRDYIIFLETNQEFITEFINIGDKIAISKKST